MVKQICKQCNTIFEARESVVKRGGAQFCSRECVANNRRIKHIDSAIRKNKHLTRKEQIERHIIWLLGRNNNPIVNGFVNYWKEYLV